MIRKVLLCSLISVFFCRRPPRPPPALTAHGGRAELADASSLIIRWLERPGPPSPPPQRPSGHGRTDHTNGMWMGTGKKERGVKEAPRRHSRPLGWAVSFKSVCWQTSDNNSGSCAVFCLATEIIFTERTSLLIKPSILFKSPVVFCSFLLFGLPPPRQERF